MPILVRPVREQLEHDRMIRWLQARWKRRYEAAVNVGDEKNASLKIANQVLYPDLILTAADRGKKLHGVVEVETGESVNHLEALAEWANFAKARAPFYLYVPASAVDIARRLCAAHHITVAELWSYHGIGDQLRVTIVSRTSPAAARAEARARTAAAAPRRKAVAPRAKKRPARAAKAAPRGGKTARAAAPKRK